MALGPNSVCLWLNVAFVCNSGSKALVNGSVKAKAAFSPNQQNSSPEPEGGAGSGNCLCPWLVFSTPLEKRTDFIMGVQPRSLRPTFCSSRR